MHDIVVVRLPWEILIRLFHFKIWSKRGFRIHITTPALCYVLDRRYNYQVMTTVEETTCVKRQSVPIIVNFRACDSFDVYPINRYD